MVVTYMFFAASEIQSTGKKQEVLKHFVPPTAKHANISQLPPYSSQWRKCKEALEPSLDGEWSASDLIGILRVYLLRDWTK